MAFSDGAHRPYIHLVDGGVADNVGMRSVLTTLDLMEALHSRVSRHGSTAPPPRRHRCQLPVSAPDEVG